MPEQKEQNSTVKPTKREQRSNKILDAALALMLRFGYSKTTIDDIANTASVAKGTIYLYFTSREDLFLALMKREYVHLIKDMQQRISNDPEGTTIHGLMKQTMLATLKNPLMKAVLLRNNDLLGEWGNKEYASKTFTQQFDRMLALVELYQTYGLIRSDFESKKVVYMLQAITVGFQVTNQLLPANSAQSDEKIADMASETIKRTLEPLPSSIKQSEKVTKQEIARLIISTFDSILSIREKKE